VVGLAIIYDELDLIAIVLFFGNLDIMMMNKNFIVSVIW
jgi:hypothetical protein